MSDSFNELDAALRELRQEHRAIGPPAFLESRLPKIIPKRRRSGLLWISSIAAALLLAAVLWRGRRAAPAQSDFRVVPGSEGLPAPIATMILRVDLPRAELRQYGLESSAERVEADFIVGDDGLARAVRIAGESR